MENNHSMSRVERSRREKVTRYSVRKVSFGAASVAVAAFFMFLGNGAVYAAEPNVTATDSALAATPANNQLDENSGSSEATVSKAQADTTTPTPADASSTSVESATVSKAQADTTTSKPADATPAPVVSSTTSTTEEKSAEKNTEASSAEANSVENKQQTTVKAEEPSATSVATTKPAEETATTESSKPKSRKKRAVDATSVDTVAATSSNENDPLAKNRKNTGQIINGDFSDTSKGATIPTEGPRNAANTYSAVTEDQMVGWKLDKTDGKTNRFDLVWAPNALPAYNYLTFGKTPNKVGANLGLYTNHNFYGGKRKEGSGPIYQDIDVTPGGEAVIRFVGSSVWNANGYNGVQVTVSDASNPGDILYKGSPFLNEAKYGVFRGILNIPANVSKIRLTFSSTVNSSFDTANMKNHLIPNEWGSSVVGDVKVSSGSFVTSSVNNIAYTETATSSSAKVVDSTVSATLTNEGYGDAMDAEYKVVLPKGATYKSGTNVKSYSFDESSRTLTLKIGEVKRDQPVKFDYTITLPADKPTRETLTGHVSYRTKGFSMNERSLSVNQATVGGQEYGIRNEFIKTESTVKQGSVDIPAQTVTVKMYKDDLQTSVTQMEETLKTLNKDDYSTESWNSLQKALRDAKKVLSETDATPIEDRADQDTINNFPILLAKEKAKLDLDKVAKEQKVAIDTKNNATREEKAEAKAKVEDALDKANLAVDAAKTVDDVATIGATQTSKITPIFPVEVSKDAAKAEIQKSLELKNAEINGNDNLTTEEKTTALAEAKKKADEAKTLVDGATTDASVERAEISGINKIESYNPAAVEKDTAKKAVEAALKAQEKAIDAKADSTTEEKEAAKEEARAKAEAAKEAIDKADSNANVAAAKEAGVGKITPVVPKAEVKPAAKQAIEDAYTAKVAEIEKRPELTTEEKAAAKAEARKLADAARANVDKAKTDDAVETAKESGTGKVEAVDPAAKAKPAAKAAVDAALAEKAKAIDANNKLSDAEKTAAKEEAKKAADEAKKAIEAATDQAGVDAKATEGTDAVEAVNPVGKEKAKAAVDAALAEKEKAIDANNKLSDAEKTAAKEEAKKAADEAKKAIEAATDQAGVDAKATEGTDAVEAVNPVGKEKAKAAVDAALAEKDKAIDANDKLSDAEKSAAKEEAKKAADEAKKAIDAATDQAGVDAKATEGTEAVAAVNPVGKDKAKAAVDAALAEKDKAIDANDKLSDAEKSAAKEEAKKAADEAKKAIDAATDQAGVDAKATEGTEAVAAVNPVGKDKAKAAVDAALAEKDKAIEANDKLSDAEKSAAKEEAKAAADEAKKAIDAATDQAGVDAKEAEGKAEIAKVTPAPAVEVGKSAAKAEIEKAAKAKEAAIDANDKLSDAEKAAAKAQVAAEAKKAIEAIEKATTEAEVEAAKEAGKAEIAKVAPATTDYKAKAKAEVEAELAKKLAELENATDLTEAEKAAAKAQVVNKAKEAIEAIQKAATEADVDQAIRNFVYRISAVIREQEEYDLSKLFVNGSVTVKQGESLTDKDVLSKLNLPSGVEIVKVEKPTTSALGTVMAKVTVKLADGSVEEINVPVEVIVSQNHGNEGNGANNGANNTEAKVNKAKLEGAIHQLDELIIKESAKLDAETAKEANDLLADAKKVFANADASQAEVDAMVKRIEDFMAKVASSTDHATPANDQSAQTSAVAPATTQAAANASQEAATNARKAAKELPNTGTADSTVAMVAAAASALLGLGLAGRRRKEDEEA